MVLSFMQTFPWGDPSLFREKIILPFRPEYLDKYPNLVPKIHTIRQGNRWKPGLQIHMAYGVRSKNYERFNEKFPALQKVISVQQICIIHKRLESSVTIDGKVIYLLNYKNTRPNPLPLTTLAVNDGFAGKDTFWQYFRDNHFLGQLIHWTPLKY